MKNLEVRFQEVRGKLSSSFDLATRQIVIQNTKVYLIFLSSLSDSKLLSYLVESIVITSAKDIALTVYPGAVEKITDETKAITAMLSGQCLLMCETSDAFYLVETRQYPSRSTAEPEVERSVRGAHDGFVENFLLNVGLVRRRIRDPKLTCTLCRGGKKTKCDIAYMYIEDMVDKDIFDDFTSRLSLLNEAEILNERNLVEELYGKTLNPYPHVRYSERPDICATHLLQGYLIVFVDNSPTAIILPTTFFEQIKQVEEYTQTTIVAFFTRMIRMVGILFSLYLLPLWTALLIDQNPTMLKIPIQEIHLFSFGIQIILADIAVEWIRQSLIHTPSILSSIMGFVAVFLLGDMAISLGAYSEEILIMVAACNIGNLLTPSYELSMANKVFRILFTLITLFFGSAGFCISVVLHVSILLSTKTVKYPYLYPLIPFSYKECKRLLLGTPIHISKNKNLKSSRMK